MSAKPPTWYVDTCIFVSLINKEEILLDGVPRWRWSQLIFEKAMGEEIFLSTSPLTVAELNGGSGVMSEDIIGEITAIFETDLILPVNLSMDIALMARDYIWSFRREKPKRELNNKDAIHLASAIAGGCSTLITWDDRHLIKINSSIPELTITSPNHLISEQQAELDLSDT